MVNFLKLIGKSQKFKGKPMKIANDTLLTVLFFSGFADSSDCNCCHTTLVLFVYLIFNTISVIEIVMGAAYFNDCSIEPMIPIYLIGQWN